MMNQYKPDRYRLRRKDSSRDAPGRTNGSSCRPVRGNGPPCSTISDTRNTLWGKIEHCRKHAAHVVRP
jgi:hypothetical protein